MTTTITTEPKLLADGFIFTECPRWRDGWLYFSDMHGQTAYRVDEGGTLEIVTTVAARPGGIGFAPDGALTVISMDDARLLRLDADGGLCLIADMSAAAPGGLNDMILSTTGCAYVSKYSTEMPPRADRLLFVDPDGAWREVGEPLLIANGMAISADGKQLIVAESGGCRLSALDLAEDGTPGNQRIFSELPADHYPDGICGDAEGGVWVACCLGPGIVRVLEGGEITHIVPMAGGRFAYACALGGADGRTLFICSAGSFDDLARAPGRNARIETVRVPFTQSGIP